MRHDIINNGISEAPREEEIAAQRTARDGLPLHGRHYWIKFTEEMDLNFKGKQPSFLEKLIFSRYLSEWVYC